MRDEKTQGTIYDEEGEMIVHQQVMDSYYRSAGDYSGENTLPKEES